jgi:hypothetical protein
MKKTFLAFVMVFFLGLPALALETSYLLITEIKIAGTTAKDEYVKICNYAPHDLDIKGYRLEKITASGKTIQPLVKSFEERVIANLECMVVYSPDSELKGDVLYDGSGTLAKDNAIRLIDENKEVVDLVGFGGVSTGLFLGQPAPNPENYQVLRRKEGQNTFNNFNDFVLVGEAPLSQEVKSETPPLTSTPVSPSIISEEKVVANYQTAKISISELYPNPTKEEGEPRGEFIELFNPNNFDVNLLGWSLEDTGGKTNKYVIRQPLIIASMSYLVITNPQSKINLNNDGDSVILRDPFDKIIYSTPNYEKAPEGKSYSFISGSWQWAIPTPETTNKTDQFIKNDDNLVVDDSPSVLGKKINTNQPVLQNNRNSGILFFFAGGLVILGYLAYLNRGEIEKRIFYKKRRGN